MPQARRIRTSRQRLSLPRPSRKRRAGLIAPHLTGHGRAAAARFSLDCQCGRVITIAGSQAGSMVTCAAAPGESSQPRPAAGTLQAKVGMSRAFATRSSEWSLPANSRRAAPAPVSGKPTDDVIELEILVPRFFKTDEDPAKQMWVLGLWAILYIALFHRSQIEEEGATIVQAPLRVARRYQGRVRRMSRAQLHRLLRTVPEYGQLLDENPNSRISSGARRIPESNYELTARRGTIADGSVFKEEPKGFADLSWRQKVVPYLRGDVRLSQSARGRVR